MNLGIYLTIGLLVLHGARSQRKKKGSTNSKGGKFIPGKTRLSSSSSFSNPRSRGPTLGDVLRRNGQQNNPRRNPTNQNQGDYNDPDPRNRLNHLTNMRNNKRQNAQNNKPSAGNNAVVQYPTIGKVIPPLKRTNGEKPPFAPSWTHCVISVQVSIAWVIVTSPGYPQKFQGQVQCSWIATAPEGYGIRVSFKKLDLLPPNGKGCGSQFVEIIDMTLEKSQARFCGTYTPGDYVSEGNKLRLDLQADAIGTPYTGFMAAFRADQEIAGRRETSYFADGQPQGLYNPLTEAPPSNPQRGVQRTNRRPATAKPKVNAGAGVSGQRIYGVKDQPRYQDDGKKEKEEEPLTSSTTHLYIIIAVILVILVAAGSTYVFKRYFYKQAKIWWKKRKNQNGSQLQKPVEDNYSMKKMQLPGTIPLPPTPNREPSIHSDEDYPDMFGTYPYPHPPSYGRATRHQLSRSNSMDDVNMGWNRDPIYEDDQLSLHSVASSLRSANRHPDHERLKHQKLLERQNSLHMLRRSFGSDYDPYTMDQSIYPVYNPYRSSGYYQMYGYRPDDVYGSLPATFGPGRSNAYDFHDDQFIGLKSPRQLYTSSTTDIPGNMANHNDFMMQQYRGRSASVYDLTTASIPQQYGSVGSASNPPALNQRHPSVTSSTNNSSTSTNPILKKTTPVHQNELAFSALRAAKSMNDLTAINTKLNESVSWTLPPQRRKSVAQL